MRTLGPREAADEIRQTILTDQSGRIPPEAAHQLKYTKEVASYLGLDPTPENVNHIALVLREHEIELPTGQEYPKWVTSPVRGAVLVKDADEENEVTSEAPPGSTEPGAPNRPTEPAPVASPVSDNAVNDPKPPAEKMGDNPNETPNPQPGGAAAKAPQPVKRPV